jgi:hypothetical protein
MGHLRSGGGGDLLLLLNRSLSLGFHGLIEILPILGQGLALLPKFRLQRLDRLALAITLGVISVSLVSILPRR